MTTSSTTVPSADRPSRPAHASHPVSVRVALGAGALAVAGWTAKAVAIGLAGGLDRSRFESPLFFVGLISFVVASVSLGVAATLGRRPWVRASAGVGAFVAALALSQVVGAVTAALAPADPSWVWAEVELWVIAPLPLAATLLLLRRRRARRS